MTTAITSADRVNHEWGSIIALSRKIGAHGPNIVKHGIFFEAVKLAHARADEETDAAMPAGTDTEAMIDRVSDLAQHLLTLQHEFDACFPDTQLGHETRAALLTHLRSAFSAIKYATIEASDHTKHQWGHGPTSNGGERSIAHLWKEASEAKEIQLAKLAELGISRIDIETHIIDPLKHRYNVDATTLTNMGLNVDMRQNSMRKGSRRANATGLPLHAMGYRQRLQYTGAY